MKTAPLRTIETPYRNARGNVVALQEGRTGLGGPLWHEAEVWPGRKSIGRVGTGDWPDLPTARAALDGKYGGAAAIDPEPAQPTEILEPGQLSETQEQALREHEAGHVAGIPPWSADDERATHETLVDLARRGCIDVAGSIDPEPATKAPATKAAGAAADPAHAIVRRETYGARATRRWLANGWFVDCPKHVSDRHAGHRYAAWAPGSGPGGIAGFIVGGDTLREVMANLAAARAPKPKPPPEPEPPPPPVADPPWACDATADPRFAIVREETLSPTFTQWHLNNGWVIIRCDGKDYRQCGWRFSAWEPAAEPGGLAAFRAGGDTMHELVAKLPAAAACVPEGSPTMPRDASAPDAAPDPPAPAPVAPGRGRGGRRKAPAAGQQSLFD